MAYSEALKKRVLSFVARAGSKAEAARVIEINLHPVFLWIAQGATHQRGTPGPVTSRKFSRDESAARVKRQLDLLLKELAAHFGVNLNSIDYALIQMGFRRKKTLLYAQPFQEKHRARRQHFLKRRNQAEQEKRPRVYIDETDFASSTCRLWAHAPIGRPAQATHNAQQRPRTNLIAGHCEHKLIAPMLFEGNCNTLLFNDWLEQILLPGLFMGSIILTGNATFRKSQKIMDLIWDAGCTPLFLSPYCPDLNPVEKL
jgi:hypothetical protein